MLHRAVQSRPYEWEPLLSVVLQSYRSTIFEATSFTAYYLAFGREMRLPVDFGFPLPEAPQSVRHYANALSEDLEFA